MRAAAPPNESPAGAGYDARCAGYELRPAGAIIAGAAAIIGSLLS